MEDLLQIPDDNEYGVFKKRDLEYSQDIKQTTESFPSCPYQVEANCELFTEYMNFVNQPNYKPTQKLVFDLTNKHKYMMHYRMIIFYIMEDYGTCKR